MSKDDQQKSPATDMSGDRPLKEGDRDWLGFTPFAEKLARIIMDQSSKDGLVIGIEGEWGSGKSSLLSLIKTEIEKTGKESNGQKAIIVDFSPWLISDRDSLISAFLGELARNIADDEGTAEDQNRELVLRLKRYAVLASSIGAGARLLGYAIPGGGLIGDIAEQVKTILDAFGF